MRQPHSIQRFFPPASLTPENELLLSCSRALIDAEGAERIRVLLRGGLDWERVTQAADRHSLMPLLYWNLNNVCPEAIPAETLTLLKKFFDENVQRNVFRTEQLLRLLEMLEARGIAAIPFKGPVLTISAYGNLALRQFNDLDVLVHERDVRAVKALFVSEGYRPSAQMDQREEAVELRRGHSFGLWWKEGAIALDLHWSIVERFSPLRLDLDEIWQRTVRVPLANRSVLGLAPEDMLLTIYVNGCRGKWYKLKLICDLATFIHAHPELNWEAVILQAGRQGSKRMLLLSLLLASELLGVALPPNVCRLMRADTTAQSLAAQICGQLFIEDSASLNVSESMSFFLSMRERLRDRARYFASLYWLTPNAKDRQAVRLPAPLSFFYYFIRPFRLAREYGLRQLKCLLRNILGS